MITEKQEGEIRVLLKAAFSSQYTDEFQQGRISMAEHIADVLGVEK